MKKVTIGIGVLVFLILFILPWGCTRVDQGFRAAKVDLMASGKGSVQEIGPGRTFYVPWRTDVVPLPVHIQRYAYVADKNEEAAQDQSINAVSSDNLTFKVGVALHYKVNSLNGCITRIYREYKIQNFRNFSQQQMRDIVRSSVRNVYSQYEATQIYGEMQPIVMEEVTNRVTKVVSQRVSVDGQSCLIVDNVSIVDIDPPNAVKKAVQRKMEAQQRAQEEQSNLRRAKIAARKDSVKASQQAENNRMIRQSVTPELIEWKKMQNQMEILRKKWDGTLPMVQGGGQGFMFDMSGIQNNQ